MNWRGFKEKADFIFCDQFWKIWVQTKTQNINWWIKWEIKKSVKWVYWSQTQWMLLFRLYVLSIEIWFDGAHSPYVCSITYKLSGRKGEQSILCQTFSIPLLATSQLSVACIRWYNMDPLCNATYKLYGKKENSIPCQTLGAQWFIPRSHVQEIKGDPTQINKDVVMSLLLCRHKKHIIYQCIQ